MSSSPDQTEPRGQVPSFTGRPDSSPSPGTEPGGQVLSSTPQPSPTSEGQPIGAPTDAAEQGGRRLLNATAVMASGTAVSRVLGLVRAMLIAIVLGNATVQANTFTLAMTVPNSLYILLAGGTLNNVLVPQIVRAVSHDSDGGKAFIDRIITGLVLVLGVLTAIITLATPLVMSIYANSSFRTPEMAEHWRALLLMSYLTMPQLFFYGIFFLIGQVLNAREKFGPMMWAPILNNVVSIAVFGAYLWIWGTQSATGQAFTDQQVWVLGVGSTIGIAVQTLVLLPYLKRAGFTYRPRFDLKGTGLGATFHIAKWMIGYVALTSLAQVVVVNLASNSGVGAYQNAYVIWILPHSLITVSLSTAMLPTASKFAAAHDFGGVASETTRALRLALTFLVPSAIGFAVLFDPISAIIYGHGAGAADYHVVAWALAMFAIGLIPYTIQYLYLRAFYALDNTRTPFLLQIPISGANALLAVLLVLAWDDPQTVPARLALSYTLAYVVGLFITHRALKRRLPLLDGRKIAAHAGLLALATLPAAALAWVITWWFDRYDSRLLQLLGLALAALLAVLAFFFTAKRLGVPETASMLDILRRRRPENPDADAVEAITDEIQSGTAEGEPGTPLRRAPDEAVPSAAPAEAPPVEVVNTDPDGTGVFVPVAPPPPGPETTEVQDYPQPSETPVEVGRLLAGRFRLDERLAVLGRTQTWRAHDQVLSRPVLVHLLPLADPQTPAVLQAARRAAVATDSRFLRVLDVIEDRDSPDPTAYLVYEYAAGQTLAKVLAGGPLTGLEAAWLVSEVADALAPLHSQGLFHRHLSPSTVLVTSNGNVKILGFGVDATGRLPRGSVEDDVAALGNLLYAGLVAHWPGGERFGLPAAPVAADGRPLPPADVRTGVAPALNQIQQRIAGANSAFGVRLLTAQAIAGELDGILGQASAASDLRARLAGPPSPADATAARGDRPLPGAGPAVRAGGDAGGAAGATTLPPVPTPASSRMYVSSPLPEEDTGDAFVEAAMAHSERFTPVPPPGPAQPSSRTKLPLLLAAVVLVAAIGLAAAAVMTFRPVTSPAAAGRLAITAVDDFDPKADGGSGAENSAKAGLAVDGNLATVWPTEKYRKATFGTKPGVGLVLDLGSVRDVTGLALHLSGRGTDVELRVPKDATDTPPMKGISSWRIFDAAKNVSDSAELTWAEPVRTRFVLVYLTALPAIGNGQYAGGIAEVTVTGR
ncbi:MAG: murein biosynthesis integral membrane protein MurJ [Propionibacteriaceae bacterium]|nr:murein biosynthesis integral membrane protein MurJ [Propionibacteriaceae bacterium]